MDMKEGNSAFAIHGHPTAKDFLKPILILIIKLVCLVTAELSSQTGRICLRICTLIVHGSIFRNPDLHKGTMTWLD